MKYSRNKAMDQMDSENRSKLLKSQVRSNKGKPEDILAFRHYFSKYTLTEGIHGPEQDGAKVYISVYHFMEYEAIDPEKYDTEKIGGYLSKLTNDYKYCSYKEQHYEKINKYDYNFIKEHEGVFEDFLSGK